MTQASGIWRQQGPINGQGAVARSRHMVRDPATDTRMARQPDGLVISTRSAADHPRRACDGALVRALGGKGVM